MRKFISAMLIITMLITCVFSTFTITTVSAEHDITVNANTLNDLINFVGDNMPDTPQKRLEVYGIMSTYMKSTDGIDTLIGVLNGSITPIPGDIQKILNGLSEGGADVFAKRDGVIFTLNLIKALGETKVTNAITKFETVRKATETAGGVENEVTSINSALNNLYDIFVRSEARTKLKSHNVGPYAILELVSAFKGSVMLTDNKVGGSGFGLKSTSKEFDTELEYITRINDTNVSSADDIFRAILTSVNTSFTEDIKSNLKKVMGYIGIYEPLTEEATQSPAPTAKPTRRPGGSDIGGIIITTPTVTPSSQPTTTPTSPSTIAPTEDPLKGYEEVKEAIVIPPPTGVSTSYSDTRGHWGESYVAAVAEKGLFKGYETGDFKPDNGITRQEMAVVLIRLLGLEDKLGTVEYDYADSGAVAPWAEQYVKLATKYGLFTGYDDGEFKPNKIISREELSAILIRGFNNKTNKVVLSYNDRSNIGSWSLAYVGEATYLGIVSGYPDGTFQPGNSVTRAEAAKMLYNYTATARKILW